jgi:hypothetical protein
MKSNRRALCAASGVAIGATMALVQSSPAAMLASDYASNYSTTIGTYIGQNGGSGFQAWTGNPSYDYIATAGGSGDTGAILTNGEAFAYWAGNTTGVVRPFLADNGSTNNVALDVGQNVSLAFEMRTAADAGPKGINIGSSSTPMFTFEMSGDTSDPDYQIADGSGTFNTSYPVESSDPIELSFTLTSPTTYSFTVTDLAASSPLPSYSTTGTLANPGDISQIGIFQAGPSNNDVYFNSLVVAPEPCSLGILSVGASALMIRRRKRAPE